MRHDRTPFWIVTAALAAALAGPAQADAQVEIPAAVAGFDNYDTAGESPATTAAHAERVQRFAGLVQEHLAAGGRYRIVALACGQPPCTAGTMAPEDLVGAARQAGARLLIYGGVHKMSTLVQMGKVQAVDLDSERLLLDRSFSFRGDTDGAFRRAAAFIARYLEDAAPAP